MELTNPTQPLNTNSSPTIEHGILAGWS